jgi:FtsH-binding integral membrane protein
MDTNMDMAYQRDKSGKRFLGAVFGYMAIGLLITAGIAALLGFLFSVIWPITDYSNPEASTYYTSYMVVLIVASVVQLGLSFWIMFGVFRSKTMGIVIPFILYAVCMGVLISSFTMFIEWYILAITFGITCLCFGSMALIGWLAKGNMNRIAIVAIGLLFGGLMIGLFNWIFWLISPAVYNILYLIVSGVTFAAMMLITMIDMWSIKKYIEAGNTSRNLALFCAFNLYVDFIYLFIRILYFILIATRN